MSGKARASRSLPPQVSLSRVAATLQAVAPAIAFEPQMQIAALPAGTKACTDSFINSTARYVTGPIPDVKSDRPRSAIVLVRVSVHGKPTSTTVYKSSGDAAFDRTVMSVAKRSTFAPAMHDCKPLSGTYEFKVQAAP